MVSTHLKNISQIGSSQVGVQMKNLWNDHLAMVFKRGKTQTKIIVIWNLGGVDMFDENSVR